MATYAIGDIQGCYRTLLLLVEQIGFDPARDRLWLVGDLVNRGSGSLEVLRWARRHDSSIVTVLGNHDLHLLGCAAGVREPKRADTLEAVLAAPDRDELLEWLRRRPLFHRDGDFALLHAGLLPGWSFRRAAELAGELEAALQGPEYLDALAAAYSEGPLDWKDELEPPDRWRSLAAVFTRLRLCKLDGQPAFHFSGPPSDAPPGHAPWFALPGAWRRDGTVVFGHWAALGLHTEPGVIALDSGCVWGGTLTAVRLPDLAVFQQPNAERDEQSRK